ncbi:putative quinol monooxygenase [Vibrio tapetis]|uniref:Antibiotic biosynthesis monooxygenase n=1 Tax=Vibrio tapetis subsp. tapetis TaxID=1671868 RepID=A0A2N8ZDZ2_9VIBR|nr:putative quinol monooxygenase [Vibrio tapetis]SON50085.1 Antibiotic biosynthesis monooxygenase [Vibrio tapetis subsp. tapetis]
MIHLTATFHAKPGLEHQLRTLLQGMLTPTRAEPGNLRYQLFQAKSNSAKFTFQEQFADQATYDEHCKAEHFTALLISLEGLLSQEPEIIFYNELAA